MKTKFIAASVQMVSGTDWQENLAHAGALVAKAAAQGAALVVLPEYFCLMGQHEQDKLALAEPFGNGPIQQALADWAREHQVWLAGGTIPLVSPEPGRVYNSTLLFSPEGQVAARYDKIHLFSYSGLGESYCEANTIVPGSQPLKVSTALGELAFGVCYDLRFPEQFRALEPYDLLLLPAAFTAVTGQAHWEVLLRARAIENQSYVLASAQGGQHPNGRSTHGHSMIIDPWGRVVAELPEGEGVILAEIDTNLIQSVRSRLPALTHCVLK
jgi:predicted amidohydrolase